METELKSIHNRKHIRYFFNLSNTEIKLIGVTSWLIDKYAGRWNTPKKSALLNFKNLKGNKL
jgi:hypothetical protein